MSKYPKSYGFCPHLTVGQPVELDEKFETTRWIFQFRENGKYFVEAVEDSDRHKTFFTYDDGYPHGNVLSIKGIGKVYMTDDISLAKKPEFCELHENPVKHCLLPMDNKKIYIREIVGRWLRIKVSVDVIAVSGRRDVVKSFKYHKGFVNLQLQGRMK